MSSAWSHGQDTTTGGCQSQDLDDVEKGLCDRTYSLAVLQPVAAHVEYKTPLEIETNLSPTSPTSPTSPSSPFHEGLTPYSSAPALSLSCHGRNEAPSPNPSAATKQQQQRPKPKPNSNMSRWMLFQLWFNTYRKFFALVTLLNLTGIVMAALDRFPYADNHLGALVLGNLLCAVLMRNELFLRILYTVAIYGLKSVSTCFWGTGPWSGGVV